VKSRNAAAQVWAAMARTETLLATFLERVARLAEATSKGLRTRAIRARALSTGIPVGADLAGEDWQRPAGLLAAPPPIPAAARDEWSERIARAKADVEDWNAALAKAKRRLRSDSEAEADWGAALAAAKRRASLPSPSR
jgi:hypothetical protein